MIISNPWNVSLVYIWGLNLIVTEAEDVLAPNSARPSADTVLTAITTYFHMFSINFPPLLVISKHICWQDDQIQNGLWDLTPIVVLINTIKGCYNTVQHVHCTSFNDLTHWGRDKMAGFFQTTFSKACSSMEMYKFWLKFHWRLFLRFQLTIFQHWFR